MIDATCRSKEVLKKEKVLEKKRVRSEIPLDRHMPVFTDKKSNYTIKKWQHHVSALAPSHHFSRIHHQRLRTQIPMIKHPCGPPVRMQKSRSRLPEEQVNRLTLLSTEASEDFMFETAIAIFNRMRQCRYQGSTQSRIGVGLTFNSSVSLIDQFTCQTTCCYYCYCFLECIRFENMCCCQN